MKLFAFDLDNTIADLGKGVTSENIARLKDIESRGHVVAVCSGKPVYYLCGLMRQVGLDRAVLIGENGAVVQLGVDLPPELYFTRFSEGAKDSLNRLRQVFACLTVDEVWYQPNDVALTLFPKSVDVFGKIKSILDENAALLEGLEIFRHSDSFDIVPAGITKYEGLELAGRILGIPAAETVAVGDGENDYPMFRYAAHSVGINLKHPDKAEYNFKNIEEALDFIVNCT